MRVNSRPTTIELHKGMSFEARLAGREGSERRVPQEGARRVWKAPARRPDPVQLVLEAEKGRLPE